MLFSLRSLIARASIVGALVALVSAGCGDGDGTTGSGGSSTTGSGGDGKYHPAPDGTHISEKEACDALVNKQGSQLLALHCVGTGQTCPSFLRAQFQTPCMEYDKGSVDGCVAYYAQQSSCSALKSAIDTCVVTPYPGTEPAGCPTSTGGSGGTGGTGGTGGVASGSGGSGGTGGTGGTGGVASGSGGSAGTASGSGGSGGMMSGSSSGSGM